MTPNAPTNGGKKQWQLWAVAAVISILAAFLGIQWQSALDAAARNDEKITQLISIHETDIDKLNDSHDIDIARLDESNRNRRNQIAELESRIARLEERTSSLVP